MNKIKNHKKTIIALFIMCVIVFTVVFFNWTSHSKKEVNTEVEVQNNSLDQKIIDIQKLLEEKVKNKEHISSEDKAKLENIEKSLSEFISKKDEIKINELYEELQKIVMIESTKKEENTTSNEITENINTNSTNKKVTETKPVVKPTTQPTTPKVEEKKKTCRIVRTPAKYKVIEHPEKFRMEPIYEQRNASCVFMPDGSEVNITGWDFPKVLSLWKNIELVELERVEIYLM